MTLRNWEYGILAGYSVADNPLDVTSLNAKAQLPQSGCKVRTDPRIKGFTTLRARRGLSFFCPFSDMVVAAVPAEAIQVIAFSSLMSNLVKFKILRLVSFLIP